MRHTTFRFAPCPSPVRAALLVRHPGASRFAYNQCLRLLTDALTARRADPQVRVPWSGFDLINAFNAWKRSEGAGRVFVVAPDGNTTVRVTGLAWRHEVAAQVFEEAAVDLGRALAAFAVAATSDGAEVGRWPASKPLQQGMLKPRRRSRAVARTRPGSRNRAKATFRSSRAYARIANIRRHFLHEASSRLVQTHDRLCLEDLAVANLVVNRHLARGITDAGWAEFARQLRYKSTWFGAELVICDRWFPSTRMCSRCGLTKQQMGLAERRFCCEGCGLVTDRDRNAAANLAAWAESHHARIPDRQADGRVNNAPGGEGTGYRSRDGGTDPAEGRTDAHAIEREQGHPRRVLPDSSS
jgi:IS605 OrfB family transposase